MKSKLNLVSCGICLSLSMGLILGCQTNSPSTNPGTEEVQTQNKLTYRNEQLGLSFTYPQGYQVEELNQGISVWKEADYQNKEDFVEVTPLTIAMAENPKNLSPREWVKGKNFQIEGEIKTKLVATSEAVIFQWSGMWFYTSVVVSHPQQNKLIIITLDEDITEYQTVFDSIVSTLKLI